MCSNNIDCLEIETNGSYFKSVTGIMVLTIALTVGLSILGAWDVAQNGSQQEDFGLPFVPENKLSEENSSEIMNSEDLSREIKTSSENSEDKVSEATLCGSSDVSVPEKGLFGPFDTEVGKMEIVHQELPVEPLPLKITDEYLDDYWIVVGTYGGYSWVSGYIKVMQAKSDESLWSNIVGYIDITAVEITSPHGWTYYNLTFSVQGNHPIILDSNHPPDSPLGDFFVWGPSDLDKFVHLKVSTTWEGCPLPEQKFMVILAHKVMSQNKIPNSR
ncbi:MAG: hypothetical protein ACXABO_16890 [Promethearchaeota archaeon]|jgi:hypothetical protein